VTLFQDGDAKDGTTTATEKEEKQPGVAEDELPPEDVTLPTDKLGRIKRGIDVRDYRPQVWDKYTQFSLLADSRWNFHY